MGQTQLFIQIFLRFAPPWKYSLCDHKPYTKDEKIFLMNKSVRGLRIWAASEEDDIKSQ